MTIIWEGEENFRIKTKALTVKIGKKNKLGDLEINNPGEYEVSGVQMEINDGVCQVFAEGMNVGHIKRGKTFSDEDLQKMSGINILLIGVGGNDFTETKTALEVINQIDPSIVIPMCKDSLEDFTKEEGAGGESQDELKISKAELPVEERKIVILKPIAG
jgi:hypothetical protein